jgi:hypothetical protein
MVLLPTPPLPDMTTTLLRMRDTELSSLRSSGDLFSWHPPEEQFPPAEQPQDSLMGFSLE